jgi:ribonuclease VapC
VIFVDASAIVAMLTEEPDGDLISDRLARHADPITSPIAIYEAVVAVARLQAWTIADASDIVDAFLATALITVTAIGEAESRAALVAFDRFGKGRHPAKLNMGDCFAYACAKTRNVPLLFKGEDFSKTDVAAA